MSDSPPGGRGAALSDVQRVDVRAMPSVLARIAALTLRYRARVALTVATSLVATIASLTLPRLYGRSIDQALHLAASGRGGGAAGHALMVTAALVIAATVTRGLLTAAAGYQSEYLSQRVAYDLRLKFFQQLQRLSFGFHDRVHSGDLITRGMLDLEGTRAFVQTTLQQALSLVMLIGFAAYMM